MRLANCGPRLFSSHGWIYSRARRRYSFIRCRTSLLQRDRSPAEMISQYHKYMNTIMVRPDDVVDTNKAVGLFGYAVDEGEHLAGYRRGSAGGPRVIRDHMKATGRLVNMEHGVDLSTLQIADFGDLALLPTGLVATQSTATAVVKAILDRGLVSVSVGGGHELSSCVHNALAEHLGHTRYAAVNVDAHVDSTPLLPGNPAVHCGASFNHFLQEQEPFEGHFMHFGCQGHQVSNLLVDQIQARGGDIMWLSAIRRLGAKAAFAAVLDRLPSDMPTAISIDCDVIRSADCPGVTLPSPLGLSAEDILDICQEAGSRPNVMSFDITELNAGVESERSGRLVALMIYYFLLGFHERPESE